VIWDEEWESTCSNCACPIKRQVNPRHYEIYHLHVILGQPVREVGRALRVNRAQIYLAKHRVGNLVGKEIKKLSSAGG
jgi:RNA polymerase sigma-70 factor (ECF subfamily)